MAMVFADVPERIIQELKTADRSRTEELFNVAIQVAALCQQKLNLRSVMSTLQSNGDAVISIVASKKSAVPYARVHRISRKIEITRKLPAPIRLAITRRM
jgi:hypothetical protein